MSLATDTALSCTERLLGERPPTVNSDVVDTVGELANIVAGAAKTRLQPLELELALPLVITGKRCSIPFPTGLKPICIPFHCEWGAVSLQVSLDTQTDQLAIAGWGCPQNAVCPPPARGRLTPAGSRTANS